MSWNDFYKHYGWKSPPPQRGLDEAGRAALDLKGLLFYFGFVWGLLIFMTGENTFWIFVFSWGWLSFLGLFSDTFPRISRYTIIFSSVALGGLCLAGAYLSELWSKEFVGAVMIAIYASLAVIYCGHQLKKMGGI